MSVMRERYPTRLPHQQSLGVRCAWYLAMIGLAVLSGFVTQPAHARIGDTTTPGLLLPERTQFERQRTLFIETEKAINSHQTRQVQKLLPQLNNYPLLPYLKYLQLTQDFRKTKEREITAFLKKYPNTRLADRLRNTWLNALARDKQWGKFLKHYTHSNSITLQCHYRTALLSKKRYKEAFQDIQTLWLVGRSQDSACDPVFAAWQQKGDFKPSLYWERAQLALKANAFQLASYLAKESQSAVNVERVTLWSKLYHNPEHLLNSPYEITSPFDQKLIAMGLTRLLRKDEALFQQAWPLYHSQLSRTEPDVLAFINFAARWFSWHYATESDYWLTLADENLRDYELMQRRIRLALYRRDWAAVHEWIGALPVDQRQEQAWQYWDARARIELLKQQAQYALTFSTQFPPTPHQTVHHSETVDELTRIHNTFMKALYSSRVHHEISWQEQSPLRELSAIRTELLDLAKNRSYYGFLASEILKQPLSLNHSPIALSLTERAKLESQPLIQAAHEWFQLGRYANARSEWSYATRDFNPHEKSLAAKLANEWGWYNQGVFTAALSDHKDDLVVRFPLGFFDAIYEQTLSQKLYADWTFALIRQESAYMHDVRSPVGALGLMQVMPGTARTVYRHFSEKYPGNHRLLSPEINVKTGTRYLAQLFKMFKGNLLLATAAYNAGPNRSISWQHPTESIPGDLWIETIPIQETRDYVKNIMAYQAIYRWHLGRPPRLSSSLERVPPLSETQNESQSS